jgi:phosphate:Na+ symporter
VLLSATLAASHVVSVPVALGLVLGANLAGGLLGMLSTLRSPPEARRVTLGNFLFKLIGCIALLPLLVLTVPPLALLSPDPARAVVNFHTGFNLALAATFILLTGPMARLLARMLPDRPVELDPSRPRHLDRSTLDTPSLALAHAAREALRMGDLIETMLRDSFEVLRRGDPEKLRGVAAMDDRVDKLHEAIKLFVTDVSREPLSAHESRHAAEVLSFTTNLEHIGDIVDKSLLELAEKKIRRQLRFSHEGWSEIEALHGRVLANLQMALGVFMSRDVGIARKLIDEKVAVREAERQAAENHLARLRAGRRESIDSSALHLDVLRDLKRIHSHICAVAFPILDEAGQLYRSRLKRFDRQAVAEGAPEAGSAPAAETAVVEAAADAKEAAMPAPPRAATAG